jgi:hypothetical protein
MPASPAVAALNAATLTYRLAKTAAHGHDTDAVRAARQAMERARIAAALTVDCRDCKQPAGQPCTTPAGIVCRQPHAARCTAIEVTATD